MDRRKFLGSLIGGVAAGAAVRSWPFRVFSFPSAPLAMSLESFTEMYVNPAMRTLFVDIDRSLDFKDSFDRAALHELGLLNEMISERNARPLIVTRGKNGLYEVPLPECPPYKVLSSRVSITS